MVGNTSKDSMYLTRIKDKTESDRKHPRHNGVRMQAHHAISAEGVRLSGMGNQLVRFKYDINLLPNLVFIPSTLQGACHLGVQPHRGDHVAPIAGDGEEDHDDDRPLTYHLLVSARIFEVRSLLKGKCPKQNPKVIEEVEKKMNGISKQLIGLIQKAPAMAPLTNVASSFMPLNKTGCAGVDSVSDHQKSKCPVGRDHDGQQGPKQRREGISLRKPIVYLLEAGR